jgi:hypothetical protein
MPSSLVEGLDISAEGEFAKGLGVGHGETVWLGKRKTHLDVSVNGYLSEVRSIGRLAYSCLFFPL